MNRTLQAKRERGEQRERERCIHRERKRQKLSMLTFLLDWWCKLPYEEQDKVYIHNLRRRINKTRNESRNMRDY